LSTSFGWEGNRRFGVALAMRRRQQWFIHLRAQRAMKGRWAPRLRSFGVWLSFTGYCIVTYNYYTLRRSVSIRKACW